MTGSDRARPGRGQLLVAPLALSLGLSLGLSPIPSASAASAGEASVMAGVAAHTPAGAAVSGVEPGGECEAGVTQWVTTPPAALERLAVRESWAYATGREVTVAVIDSGVADANAHFPAGAVLDGRSFVEGRATSDSSGHGTAVAGIIAARELPQSGVVGVARESTILPVRISGERSRAEDLTPALMGEAIRYAASAGADIINVSLSTAEDDEALAAAVREAQAGGALIVASGGNLATSDVEVGPRYPAAYEGVLGVAATGPDDRPVEANVPGPHIDLAAPAFEVATTFLANGDCVLGSQDSVSFATAYVSGAAALVAERFREEGPEGWAHRLTATAAREQRTERTDAVGWGIVQPRAALTLEVDDSLSGPLPPGVPEREPEPEAAESIDLTAAPDPAAGSRAAAWGLGLAAVTLTLALALVRLMRGRNRFRSGGAGLGR